MIYFDIVLKASPTRENAAGFKPPLQTRAANAKASASQERTVNQPNPNDPGTFKLLVCCIFSYLPLSGIFFNFYETNVLTIIYDRIYEEANLQQVS